MTPVDSVHGRVETDRTREGYLVTVRIANYEQHEVMARYQQSLGEDVFPSQVAVDQEAGEWSMDAGTLEFVAKIPWASDVERTYVLEDVAPGAIAATLRTATLDVRDMDGTPLEVDLTISGTIPGATGSGGVARTGDQSPREGTSAAGHQPDSATPATGSEPAAGVDASASATQAASTAEDAAGLPVPQRVVDRRGTEMNPADDVSEDPGGAPTEQTPAGEDRGEDHHDSEDPIEQDGGDKPWPPVTRREYVLRAAPETVSSEDLVWHAR